MEIRAARKTGLLVSGLTIALSMGAASAADTADHQKAPAHTIALATVENPKDTLSHAKVEDAKGTSVGSVDDVMLDKKGKPTSLKVDVGSFLGIGGKDVAIKAGALKFDRDRKVLITTMTKDQIKKLPEVKS
jgi:sporulation protein YlmC with PRC-barrel domain